MLQTYYPDRSPEQVAKSFGPNFARRLFEQAPGAWRGPVESGFGWHLVWIDELTPQRIPPFDEIEAEVRQAWIADRRDDDARARVESLGRGRFVAGAGGGVRGLRAARHRAHPDGLRPPAVRARPAADRAPHEGAGVGDHGVHRRTLDHARARDPGRRARARAAGRGHDRAQHPAARRGDHLRAPRSAEPDGALALGRRVLVGVELGQLLFIAAVLGLRAAAKRLPLPRPLIRHADAAASDVIGTLAAFWFVERVAGFWA